MSNKQDLQEVVKALTAAKKEIKEAVSKAVTQIETARQVRTERQSPQS